MPIRIAIYLKICVLSTFGGFISDPNFQRPPDLAGRRAARQPRPYDRRRCAETLQELVRHTGLAALIATHNIELARRLDRIVGLEDARLKPLG